MPFRISIILLFFLVNTNAQNDLEWAISYGNEMYESPTSMLKCEDGNIMMVGFRNSLPVDREILIYKLNTAGDIIWQKQLNIPNVKIYINNILPSVNDNGYLLLGSITLLNQEYNDLLVVKIDEGGEIQWYETYGGSNSEGAGYGVLINNGYIIAGTTRSTDGDVIGNNGDSDIWIIWINEFGELLKSKCYGGSYSDACYSIALSNDGFMIFSGSTQNQGSGSDYWVVKSTIDGEIIWENSYGGSEADFKCQILLTEDNSIIAVGESNSNDFDIPNDNHGEYDLFALKINSEGAVIWSKSYGGFRIEFFESICFGVDQSFFMAGQTRSDDGDVNSYNGGYNDYWVVQVSIDDGSIIWESNFGGSEGELAKTSLFTGEELYVAGSCGSNDIDINEDNSGGSDIWVIKLNNILSNNINVPYNENNAIQIYPNPTNTFWNLKNDGHLPRQFHIELYDLKGTKLLSKQIVLSESQEFQLSKSVLPGMYLLYTKDMFGNVDIFKLVKN